MTNYAAQNPYELWTSRKSLGLMRDVKREDFWFDQFFSQQLLSQDEYIDFEKLPIMKRKLAPFVLPLGRGRGVWEDSQRSYRFKPAYSIVEETIDPLMPLSFQPGLGESVFEIMNDPMRKLDLIRAAMLAQMTKAHERRWEWMRAQAIINGQYIVSGPDYPATTVAFGRDSANTITLTGGNRWGDSGVSIVSFINTVVDQMNNQEFSGIPTKITMGGGVASVIRNDAEVLSHMDRFVDGGTIRVDRGVVAGAPYGGKVYKFGELQIGGASGQRIELWVNNEVYIDDSGTSQRYVANNQAIFTADPSMIMGYQCFGRIVDRDAQYQAIPLFPKSFFVGEDVKSEHMSIKSAPLMVPINPNATLKATVIA